MSSLSQEASIRYNQVKKANPGMTTNQALIASGAGSMVDLNNKLYDTGVSSKDVPAYSSERPIPDSPPPPQITPLDFGKTLLNQVVGITENPNNLSSERVLQLVRQGVQKPDFMQEYLNSGGVAPQYSVLNDSEYRDAYRTDQVPDKRDDEGSLPTPPDNGLPKYIPPYDVPDQVPFLPPAGQPSMPGDPGGPNYQNSLGPNRTDGLNPATGQPYTMGDPANPNYQNTLPPVNPQVAQERQRQQQQQQQRQRLNSFLQSSATPSVSEDLLQGNFQAPLPMYNSPPMYGSPPASPMYGPPPAQQGYNYNPDVMAKLLQKLSSTQM